MFNYQGIRVPDKELIYSNHTQNPLTNLLLVSTEVQEYQQFIDSANQNTFAVAYSRMSSKTELMELLRSKTQSLKRIGFVFHSPGNNEKAFLDGKSLFLTNELANDSGACSENLQWLLDVISEFGIKNVDYLACNTLNSDLWKNYYSFLAEKKRIIVGASDDKTGNLKYGGDWIMENTGEDVEKVYFTQSIEYYKYLLDPVLIGDLYYTLDSPSTGQATVATDAVYATYTTVTIPSSVTNGPTTYPVVSIEPYAFYNCAILTTVNILPGLETIGEGIFYGCTTLASVTIPSSVTTIESNAFSSCSLLSSITIPSGVKTIGGDAFYSSGLSSVNIPSTVTAIPSNPFSQCNSLTTITVDPANANFSADNNVLYNNTQTTIVCYPAGLPNTSFTFPIATTTINDFAFDSCKLTSLNISSIITINAGAFANSPNLSSIAIPSGIVNITDYVFQECSNLASVTIPNSVTSIGFYTFFNCTSLASITLPNNLKFIGGAAFNSCTSLGSISIPSSVTTMDNNAFNSCSNLSNVNISNGITYLSGGLFYSCSIASITIPNSVTSIGGGAFFACNSLTSVIIPSSITTISDIAFLDCTSLTSVYFNATNTLPEMFNNSFGIEAGADIGTAYYNTGVFEYGTSTPADTAYFQSVGFLNAEAQGPGPDPGPLVCFKEGSRILTKNGYIRIQDLRKGDLIKTVLHNYVPIAMIGKRDIYHAAKKDRIKDQLYKCTSEKYPEVFEELVITGCHSILVDQFASQEQREKTIEVNKIKMVCVTNGKYRLPACVDDRASVYEKPGNYTIYHLALENPDYYMNYGIYANGLLVETCSKRYLKEVSNMTLIN